MVEKEHILFLGFFLKLVLEFLDGVFSNHLSLLVYLIAAFED